MKVYIIEILEETDSDYISEIKHVTINPQAVEQLKESAEQFIEEEYSDLENADDFSVNVQEWETEDSVAKK